MKADTRLLLSAVLTLTLLAGCTGLPPGYSSAGLYRVKPGDTLYSIAFRYGLDYKSLAQINGIGPPYTIFVDQTIKLRGSAKMPEQDGGPSVATTRTRPPAQSTRPQPVIKAPSAPVSAWRWPLQGDVIKPFSLKQPANKGIGIAGKRGAKVIAAADGAVVYAGGNLRGYGKLVIIKHNDTFLSAYGNNSSLLVKEGESVRAGKAIARVGNAASDQEMLHFEIRVDGKPVDPLKYLPKP